MANSKISALTSATTPLAGTETVPIVQSGVTVKATVANITGAGAYAGSFTTLSATGVTTVQAGTALLPAITTSGDTNTGIWFPAADTIAFTEGGAESMRITSAGNVGIGTNSPASKLQVSDSTNGGAVEIIVANTYYLATSIDESVSFQGEFYQDNVAANRAAGYMRFTKVGDFSNNANASANIIFATRNAGTLAEKFRIDSTGNALVTGAGGLGYGTGSGGTVTQATSRTTGVTLNKTNGAITLVSAAGLATFQSFTVTNSTVAATDVVRVTQKSGTDLYQIFVTATAAGSFRITYATTGGITVEQPVFNFAVMKGVTS